MKYDFSQSKEGFLLYSYLPVAVVAAAAVDWLAIVGIAAEHLDSFDSMRIRIRMGKLIIFISYAIQMR